MISLPEGRTNAVLSGIKVQISYREYSASVVQTYGKMYY